MKKKEPLYKIIQNPDHEKLLEDQPSIVYKYFDWRNTHNQRVLTHNELFFSSPNNFNDPFDCKIETRFDLMDEKEKYEYFTRVSTNYSKHYNLGWNKDMIEKEVSRLIKEHDFSNTEKVWADNEFLFKQTSNFYGVFCTSTLWDSIPMWGYYANCHKGFCVVFGVRELFYSGRIGKGGMVTYDNYPEIKPNMSAIEKASKETYHKSKDWSHEKEYRLMQLRMPKHKINTITGENGEFIGIKTIAHENWFKEILIGVNTSEEDTAQIISSCRNKRNDRPTFLFIFGKYLFVF
jgi:hypothetical protein